MACIAAHHVRHDPHLLQLLHERRINLQSSCGVDDDSIHALLFGQGHSLPGRGKGGRVKSSQSLRAARKLHVLHMAKDICMSAPSSPLPSIPRDVRRWDIQPPLKHRHTHLASKHHKLLNGCRTVHVSGHQHDSPALVLEEGRQLGSSGRLASALQSRHQDDLSDMTQTCLFSYLNFNIRFSELIASH